MIERIELTRGATRSSLSFSSATSGSSNSSAGATRRGQSLRRVWTEWGWARVELPELLELKPSGINPIRPSS